MYSEYLLRGNELDNHFINAIHELFGDRQITITVSDSIDETAYLLSSPANKERLLNTIERMRKGEGISEFDYKKFANEA